MNTLEKQLRDDADEILNREALAPLDDSFQRQLAATRQEKADKPDRRRPTVWQWALPTAAAAAVVALFALSPESRVQNNDATQAIVTPIEAPEEPLMDVDKPDITPVGYEQALINEWEYIRDDLSLTKEKIEEDLSIQF
ncbi:MAG: hypothetical protein AAAFM81_14495 [Pseudomonadota bacterium]